MTTAEHTPESFDAFAPPYATLGQLLLQRSSHALLLMAIAGCATAPPLVSSAPTVEAKVPVIAPCVDEVEPIPATAMPPRTAPVDALAAGAAADLIRLREYARTAKAKLEACAKVK